MKVMDAVDFGKAQLILVGGRPAMGKSSFILSLLEAVCKKEKKKILYYSLDLSAGERARKLARFNMPFGIRVDSGFTTIHQFCEDCKNDDGYDIVVVDYLTLPGPEMEDATRELKQLSKDLNCVVMVAFRMPRISDSKKAVGEYLEDLSYMGKTTEIADDIWIIYREAYYSGDKTDNSAELIIAKSNKNAPACIDLEFDAEQRLFLGMD